VSIHGGPPPITESGDESFHEAENGRHGKLAAGRGGEVIGAVRAPGEFEEVMIVAICAQFGEATAVTDADEGIERAMDEQRGQAVLIEKRGGGGGAVGFGDFVRITAHVLADERE
jgi:hypothetical protein